MPTAPQPKRTPIEIVHSIRDFSLTTGTILDLLNDKIDYLQNYDSTKEGPLAELSTLHSRLGELATLPKAVNAVIEGKPLPREQQNALSKGGELIELIAQHEEFKGGMAHDDVVDPIYERLLEIRYADKAREGFNYATGLPEAKQKLKDERLEEARDKKRLADVFRQEIIPLFRELAQSLHIPFNEPNQGRS
jgi:hypothetical protein